MRERERVRERERERERERHDNLSSVEITGLFDCLRALDDCKCSERKFGQELEKCGSCA